MPVGLSGLMSTRLSMSWGPKKAIRSSAVYRKSGPAGVKQTLGRS